MGLDFSRFGFVTAEYSEVNGRMLKVGKRGVIMNAHGIPAYRQNKSYIFNSFPTGLKEMTHFVNPH